MKDALTILFGATVGVVISVATDYSFNDKGWWTAVLPILLSGWLYANFGRGRKTS